MKHLIVSALAGFLFLIGVGTLGAKAAQATGFYAFGSYGHSYGHGIGYGHGRHRFGYSHYSRFSHRQHYRPHFGFAYSAVYPIYYPAAAPYYRRSNPPAADYNAPQYATDSPWVRTPDVAPPQAPRPENAAYCREYTQPLIIEGEEVAGYGRACRQPDGSWKIVE